MIKNNHRNLLDFTSLEHNQYSQIFAKQSEEKLAKNIGFFVSSSLGSTYTQVLTKLPVLKVTPRVLPTLEFRLFGFKFSKLNPSRHPTERQFLRFNRFHLLYQVSNIHDPHIIIKLHLHQKSHSCCSSVNFPRGLKLQTNTKGSYQTNRRFVGALKL